MTRGQQGEQGVQGEQGERGGLPRRIEASFWLVVLVAVVVIAALCFVIADNRRLARDGKEAHDSLCVFKADLERRVAQTQAILDETENGVIFGIPRATIEQSLGNQQSTLAALATLDCVPPPDKEK